MTNLASIPDAAIGAMVAACIGGFISFVGLVISKEMKTSDFRQAWIDALREDIAQMLAHANLVRAVLVTHPTKDLERFAALSEPFAQLAQSNYLIRLRLNAKERSSNALLTEIDELRSLMIDQEPINIDKCVACEKKILASAREILKTEWTRVKDGERVFRWTKRAVMALVLGGLALMIYVGWVVAHTSGAPASAAVPATSGPLLAPSSVPLPTGDLTPSSPK
jgi:hypothetical protein